MLTNMSGRNEKMDICNVCGKDMTDNTVEPIPNVRALARQNNHVSVVVNGADDDEHLKKTNG